MDGNTREKVAEAKPIIRSILLALGKRATEREFRREYFNNSGEIFNDFLLGLGLNFYQFMRTIPDVCQVWKANTIEGNEVFVERVSTEESSHMDSLTIIKKKKKGLKQPVSGFR